MISLAAGFLTGAGSDLITSDKSRYVTLLLSAAVLAFAVLGGQMVTKPLRRVAEAAVPSRRELLAEHDWSPASGEELDRGARLRHDWKLRLGPALIAVLPLHRPPVWPRCRISRATLRDLGAELRKAASATLAVITSTPPWTPRHRAREALRLPLNLDQN